ncbi:hypothetical protein [Flavilitoribacter nigricans]|uniref:Uncharacterized protein n=1 Tax=Flavilitoribacter nigricans (strain ATCC 23147 / DSM 23189 / NBRC 102662 / NCIMB 1420 / SS-2) TaxID=1122177 RepID=A0A2D0NBG5_FLAN2|nr:hypothetical protein [Flavilitoribacter nigricans]PHN05852.1 hypothetical protein CRP01_15390 [Flavilitoribacter nigricans DSM 23189 = NBRC 102662]
MKGNIPSRKKQLIPPSSDLEEYLAHYNRHVELPLHYEDLTQYESSLPLLDQNGEDTLWETVYYGEYDRQAIFLALTQIYSLLKTDGDTDVIKHLTVARIDFCTFGNTKPFRIRIINRLNDNYDHFYIKKADASRIYGLELEDLLSPNRVIFLIDGDTLIEEHVAGIPGDDFMKEHLETSTFNQIRIAKEFIKFNERCFVRLLGDMRSYNYVVDITPDIEGSQYRLRAIDFDQQSYEGRKSFYLPQYFKENNPIIFMGIQHMRPKTVTQYQLEERSLIAARVKTSPIRFRTLFQVMIKDRLSSDEKVAQLKEELSYHHKTNTFDHCQTMGDIVLANIKLLLAKDFKQSIMI